jgi:acyl carrier protein
MSSPVLPTPTAPATVTQSLAAVPTEVVGAEQVSADAHFFDDLGADSMATTRFCAQVRKHADLVSIKEIYQHPTVRDSATVLTPAAAPVAPVPPEPARVPPRPGWAPEPAGICILSVLGKWSLVARWNVAEIRVWSRPYLRFWVFRALVQGSPMALFAGSLRP